MKYNVSSLEIQKQQSSGKRNIYHIHFILRNKLKAYYDKLREEKSLNVNEIDASH